MARLIISLLILAGGITQAQSANSFLCVAEQSTGFLFEHGKWASANFTTGDDKFLIKKDLLAGMTHSVTKIGNKEPTYRCKNLLLVEPMFLSCGGLGYGFQFSEATMRFQKLYGVGYVNGQDSKENTPSLTIGTCSPID